MSELTDERLRQLREHPHGRDSVTVLALLDEIERLRVRAEGAEKALREIAMGSPVPAHDGYGPDCARIENKLAESLESLRLADELADAHQDLLDTARQYANYLWGVGDRCGVKEMEADIDRKQTALSAYMESRKEQK